MLSAHHFILSILTINTYPFSLDNCKYSQSFLSLFSSFIFAGLFAFYVQQNKKNLICSHIGKDTAQKNQGNPWVIFSTRLYQYNNSGKIVASVKWRWFHWQWWAWSGQICWPTVNIVFINRYEWTILLRAVSFSEICCLN